MEIKLGCIENYFSSLFYNREVSYIVKLLKEIRGRIDDTFPCHKWTDEGDIIYGWLVMMFGDYGVSPRAGWINSENIKPLLNEIDDEIEYYNEILERGEDE